MKFTPQRMKFLHSIDGVNYLLDFFLESNVSEGNISVTVYNLQSSIYMPSHKFLESTL